MGSPSRCHTRVKKRRTRFLTWQISICKFLPFEYHNVTWTWLDLLLAVKSRTRESLLAQAFKQKFLRKGTKTEDHQETSEEEKAQLLLGKQVGNQPGGSVRTSRRFLPLRK